MSGSTGINTEHTCWFCDVTLTQLLQRVGFCNVRTYFVSNSFAFLGIGRLPRLIRRRFSDHILVVAQTPVVAAR